ncbi:MAG TPA: hypothetical protein VMU30_03950 [Bacteroidota bacterium]|nr:hypothetical protein [Bacteroidota bacterium]
MTAVDQHRMVQEIKSRYMKLNAQERKQFDMIAKRDRDDEDLDSFSLAQLRQMHTKYFPKLSKQDLDDAWKKLTGNHS